MDYITIDKQKNIQQNGMTRYQYGDIDIYVDGLIYVYGKKAGKESIDWLADSLHNTGGIPYEELHGAFSCIIRENDIITAFSDNSCMHCLYYSNNIISNRFLKIVEYEAKAGKQLIFNENAICEYLTIGNVFFEKTFFNDIHILHSANVITIIENKICIFEKQIKDIDGISNVTSFGDFFDKVAFSLSDMKICQALTGGYDSRLIYACLSKRTKDHPAIAANDRNNKDVKYAQLVTVANNDNLDIIEIDKPDFSELVINDLFIKKDGMEPFDIDADYRLLTFYSKLAKEHNILITGDGGVLHKDWEWTQDFPLYKKKKSNALQFYNQRLYYISIDNHIGDKLQNTLKTQANRFNTVLSSIAKSINTQSYDAWYFWVSGNRRTQLNCNPIEGIISYAPLQEMDIVRYSYALPRWKRFFFNSIRETISKENKRIARVKTNYGTNASCEIPYLIIDVYYQSIEYFRKAYRYISRKLIHRNVMDKTVLNWTMEKDVRSSRIAIDSIEYARLNGFIQPMLSVNDLSYFEIQRLIHIYCLYNYYINQKQL